MIVLVPYSEGRPLVEGNDKHEPAGSPRGGQFAKKDGGGAGDRFPPAPAVVSGLKVAPGPVPNTGSIESSLDDYEVLPGVREVRMSEFDPSYKVKPYSASESDRLDTLQQQITDSKTIAPLIIVVDNERYPYVLEGGHRFDALKRLGVASFPALVVFDKS